MMLYRFRCKDCKRDFVIELKSFITDKDVAYCPNCYAVSTDRVYDTPTVVYRADGFYSTDNKET